jgi:hypothetical protein
MAGVIVIGFADAGPQGAVRLDPSTGARTATTSTTGSGSVRLSRDGRHAADVTHTAALGDDGDVAAHPGPPGPFNTLRSFTVGGPPGNVRQAVHHNISVLALSDDGSTLAWFDDTSAGGFAGISMSPEFGLFVLSGTSRTQLQKYGPRWDAAAFTPDLRLLAAKHEGSAETLQLFAVAGGVDLDSVAGDGALAISLY